MLADEWAVNRRAAQARATTSMCDRIYIIVPQESPLLAITLPNNERTELPLVDNQEWALRLDGMPVESVEIGVGVGEAEWRDAS